MVVLEAADHNGRTEGASGIEGAASEVNACSSILVLAFRFDVSLWLERRGRTGKFSNKERDSDPDRSKERAFVFLSCKHKDSKDELESQKHFNKQALDDGGAAAEGGRNG